MPRGGVRKGKKKQRSVGDRLSSVSGTSAVCHEVV